LAGALAYGELMVIGLRTWWIGRSRHAPDHAARLDQCHWPRARLAGIVTGLATIAWTLRKLEPVTPSGLLAGEQKPRSPQRAILIGAIAGALAIALLAATLMHALDQTAGFFGAGTLLLLIAALALQSALLHRRSSVFIGGLFRLAFRSAAYRPGRSILCIAQIACATFLIVSVDAFRRSGPSPGTYGYPLMAESDLPLIHDPNTADRARGTEHPAARSRHASCPFRLRPGDDVSCLNLYQPRNPRILRRCTARSFRAHAPPGCCWTRHSPTARSRPSRMPTP
jgi:putative ABC transport system permease protein